MQNQTMQNTTEVILAYKRGSLNLDQAIQLFSSITGMSDKISAKFLSSCERHNIINFCGSKKAHANFKEAKNDD